MPPPIVSIFDVGDYDAQIHRAAELLQGGGIVVLPTETVYGSAGLLNHSASLERLKQLRRADRVGPFTVHLGRREEANQYIGQANEFAQRLMKKLWPGPVGLLFEVPDELRRETCDEFGAAEGDLYDGPTIALRCPDHIVCTDILHEVRGPVALTLAQGATRDPGHSVEQFAEELTGKVDLIIDAGASHYNKPSTILKVCNDKYEIVRAGVYDERIIERLLRTTILFVCSGNTCRSPMAEAIARRVLAKKLRVSEEELESKGVSVISAGSFAMPGARATPQAVEALKKIGTDLTRHRSRPLTVEVIHQADMIYTMSRSHAQAVMALVPSAADKVVTLNPDGDIDDPIGGDVALYQELAGTLQTLIEKRLEEQPIP